MKYTATILFLVFCATVSYGHVFFFNKGLSGYVSCCFPLWDSGQAPSRPDAVKGKRFTFMLFREGNVACVALVYKTRRFPREIANFEDRDASSVFYYPKGKSDNIPEMFIFGGVDESGFATFFSFGPADDRLLRNMERKMKVFFKGKDGMVYAKWHGYSVFFQKADDMHVHMFICKPGMEDICSKEIAEFVLLYQVGASLGLIPYKEIGNGWYILYSLRD